jgi:hypothetical protein
MRASNEKGSVAGRPRKQAFNRQVYSPSRASPVNCSRWLANMSNAITIPRRYEAEATPNTLETNAHKRIEDQRRYGGQGDTPQVAKREIYTCC